MRVNVYAEEMTNRVELIQKGEFIGIRFYLELPVTLPPEIKYVDGCQGLQEYSVPERNVSGPFIHHPGDDDSAAVTFWGKRSCREVFQKALELLDEHYEGK